MTGEEFRQARLNAGRSIRKWADALEVALSSVQRWEKADQVPGEVAAKVQAIFGSYEPQHRDAYLLGRLAAIAKVVGNLPVLPRSILNTAQANPAMHYGQLVGIIRQPRHQAELTPTRRRWIDRQVTAISAGLPHEMPKRIADEPFSSYWLGYYHQQAELYAREDNPESDEADEGGDLVPDVEFEDYLAEVRSQMERDRSAYTQADA